MTAAKMNYHYLTKLELVSLMNQKKMKRCRFFQWSTFVAVSYRTPVKLMRLPIVVLHVTPVFLTSLCVVNLRTYRSLFYCLRRYIY